VIGKGSLLDILDQAGTVLLATVSGALRGGFARDDRPLFQRLLRGGGRPVRCPSGPRARQPGTGFAL